MLGFLFQGMVDYRVLQIHSTFREYMEVTGVTFQPSDSRFYYEPPNTERILLVPDKPNNVRRRYLTFLYIPPLHIVHDGNKLRFFSFLCKHYLQT
jgi:hypothetical protein